MEWFLEIGYCTSKLCILMWHLKDHWKTSSANILCFSSFVSGSIWTYGSFSDYQTEDINDARYCDSLTYNFSFWYLTITYMWVGLFLFCCLCCAFVNNFAERAQSVRGTSESQESERKTSNIVLE